MTSFAIAVERDRKSATGERECDFIDVVAWGNTADFASKWIEKGQMISVQGRLQIRRWKNEDGRRCKKAEVIAEHISFCGAKVSSGDTADDYVIREIPDYDEGNLPFN